MVGYSWAWVFAMISIREIVMPLFYLQFPSMDWWPTLFNLSKMGVSSNGGFPQSPPQVLIIFSRKTHGLVGETHHFSGNPHMDVSENSGFSPQIIHFNRVFHDFHHPFWGNSSFFRSFPDMDLDSLTFSKVTHVQHRTLLGSFSEAATGGVKLELLQKTTKICGW